MKIKSKNSWRLALLIAFLCTACFGNGSSSPSDIIITPNVSPEDATNLSDLVVNTFQSSGIDIAVTPTTIDFSEAGDISQDDEVTQEFTLTNRSGAARTFNMQFYAVSSGFSVLDENQINLGTWSGITINNGETKKFYARFHAWVFGTQTTYLTISADVSGYIQLPMRATVSGAADFRIIPTGYLCSDTSAPSITDLDFLRVAYGQTKTQGIKICNTGGEDITVNSAQILTATSTKTSAALETNAYENFIWTTEDEINASFSLGLEPNYTASFTAPNITTYTGTVPDPTGSYTVFTNDTGASVKNISVPAGELLRLDVHFSPTLNIEAPAGSLYEPISNNAKLRLTTSLGVIDIALVGATAGKEPVLKLSYRLSDSDTWRTIDDTSNSPALYFGEVGIFSDWVSDNDKDVIFKVENIGTGNQDLEFYPKSIVGYFEYADELLALPDFPIVIPASGAAQEFSLRYAPTPTAVPESISYDYGQFYYEHTGGNGPQGKIALIGKEEASNVVTLKAGGSTLKHTYTETESKNLCVVQIDNGNPATAQTFTIINNNPLYVLTANWSVTQDADSDADFTATSSNGTYTLTVAPNASSTFTVNLLASSTTSEGANIRGTLTVTTDYPAEVEAAYASELAVIGDDARNFSVPFTAQASGSGVCELGGGRVIGSDSTDVIHTTAIIDRVSMVMPNLTETTHNSPAYKFHLPIDIDHTNGRAWVSNTIPFDESDSYSPISQFRAYAWQFTNINGCQTKPTTPYVTEDVKGSHTGPGFDCHGDGEISYDTPDGSKTMDTDTQCLPSNGAEQVEVDGVMWTVFYHDFVKFDTSGCDVEYYGKIATFAYAPALGQTMESVFLTAKALPDGSEQDYEQIYGSYKYGSYIAFNQTMSCGSKSYSAGDVESDPDAIKACYGALALVDDNTRTDGFVNECSYFNFKIDAGTPNTEETNPDDMVGAGYYERHVNPDGSIEDTKYDLTLYNVHLQFFIVSAGDRVSFLRHPGKLLYSDLYLTFTTKTLADESDTSQWDDLIAVRSRSDFTKDKIYLKNGAPYQIDTFWTGDHHNELLSNVIDDDDLESGYDFGGYGKGNFNYCTSSVCDIIPAGRPINFDENNLFILTGLSSIHGISNVDPGFAAEDSSGKGKPLYFSLHGCLVEGEADETQGCFSYKLDDAKMVGNATTSDDTVSVIDLYEEHDILPSGFPADSSECAHFVNDPSSEDYDPYRYLSCINFKIFPQDRDRFTDYYNSNNFYYQDDVYGSKHCGYGN